MTGETVPVDRSQYSPLELRPVGRHALLAEVADSAAARSLAAYARAARVAAEEVVPGLARSCSTGSPMPARWPAC